MDGDKLDGVVRAAEPHRDVEGHVALARLKAAVRSEPRKAIRVGRYELGRRVGAGGLGVVFAARDPELDREVAVKLVEAQRGTRDLLEEARTLARLAHPNVVHVLDAGTYDPSVFGEEADAQRQGTYIVTELIEGQTLEAWSATTRPVADVVAAYLDAAKGLAAAHDAGIVHRDFKPSNAIVDAEGRVRVLDFGLARIGDADADGGDLFAGTPAYMAPEQRAGDAADARSDQYAWAVSFFEALTGQRPVAATAERLEEPPDKARISVGVHAVLRRALEPEAQQRWPSMHDAIAALDRSRRSASAVVVVAIAGVVAAGVFFTGTTPPCPAPDEHRAQLWGDAARDRITAAFVAAGAPDASATAARVGRRLDRYASELAAAQTASCESIRAGDSDGSADCLLRLRLEFKATVDAIANADAPVVSRSLVAVGKLTPARTCANTLSGPDRPANGKRVAALEILAEARALGRTGRLAQAKEKALAAMEAGVTLGDVDIEARGCFTASLAELLIGDSTAAIELAERCYGEAAAAGAYEPAAWLAVHLAFTQIRASALTEAEVWIGHGQAAIDRLGNPPDLEGVLCNHRGALAYARGDGKGAETWMRRSAEFYAEAYPDGHEAHARAVAGIGAGLDQQGRREEALAVKEQALAMMEDSLGPDHPDLSPSLINVAASVYDKDPDRAIAALERAQAITELHDLHGPEVPALHNNMGKALEIKERYAAAIEQYELALAIHEADGRTEHRDVAWLHFNIGRAKRLRGDADQALGDFERGVELMQTVTGPDNPELVVMLLGAADAYLEVEQPRAADRALIRAEAIVRRTPAQDNSTATLAFLRAKVSAADGDLTTAREHAEHALDLATRPADRTKIQTWLAELANEPGDHND